LFFGVLKSRLFPDWRNGLLSLLRGSVVSCCGTLTGLRRSASNSNDPRPRPPEFDLQKELVRIATERERLQPKLGAEEIRTDRAGLEPVKRSTGTRTFVAPGPAPNSAPNRNYGATTRLILGCRGLDQVGSAEKNPSSRIILGLSNGCFMEAVFLLVLLGAAFGGGYGARELVSRRRRRLRGRGSEIMTLKDRRTEWANRLHQQAAELPPGRERDAILKKVRQAEDRVSVPDET
jgi:hypothetical protein